MRQAVAYFFEEDWSVSRAQAITAGILKTAALGGYTSYIARAIERLNQDFDQPLRIEGIANELGMSVSELHHHFKAVTALSPLQFQKRLRLQEARRLMLGEGLDATSAGIRVGYGSPSQFSREYHRLFGAPPLAERHAVNRQPPVMERCGKGAVKFLRAGSRYTAIESMGSAKQLLGESSRFPHNRRTNEKDSRAYRRI